MDSSHAHSREYFQQAIDAEVKSLEESIRALKHRRNALSPVSSLPPEVFAAIFSFVCLPVTSSPGGKQDHHLALLHVSHVCHQWREIAVNQPLLWSHVDFTSLSVAGIAEMLVRARSVPLSLEASVLGHRWDDVRFSTFRKELQARVPHIRQLRIGAEPIGLQNILKGLVLPAPALEYLSLSSLGEHRKRRMGGRICIPDTLFDGSTPRLSCIELCNCNISWKSPLLKGLKCLEILAPSESARPKLVVWLGALDEMSELKTLILHWASPIAPPSPFDVEHTVTLPSLTRLDILASPGDCALALAHLDLPALTWLGLTTISHHLNIGDVQNLVPYVTRHAHGPQDIQPLQSVLIHSEDNHTNILAWPVPGIDSEVHDPPTLLAATLPTRVALSFRCDDWPSSDTRLEVLETAMADLPMDGLVMLAAHDLRFSHERDFSMRHFWFHLSPKWPLLKRVRLAHPVAVRGFIEMLLVDIGEREMPLLPSLTELVVVDIPISAFVSLPLCDALMNRVEQGVPVERLDLRRCFSLLDGCAEELRLLSEIVVDVLGPVHLKARQMRKALRETVARDPFRLIDNDHSREDSHSDTSSDDEDEDDEE